jgi:hypothetical protein
MRNYGISQLRKCVLPPSDVGADAPTSQPPFTLDCRVAERGGPAEEEKAKFWRNVLTPCDDGLDVAMQSHSASEDTARRSVTSDYFEKRRTDEERLEKALIKDPKGLAREAGLDGGLGPNKLPLVPPSRVADELALGALGKVLPGLEAEYRLLGLNDFRPGQAIEAGFSWPVELPPRLDGVAAGIGLPIVGAFCPTACAALARVLLATHLKNFTADHPRLRRLLTLFIFVEQQQWEIARVTMPYSFRYRLMSWVWDRRAHRHELAYAICLRCGSLVARSREPLASHPLCSACAKESPTAREWPANAVAPAEQGKWWLRCDYSGCTTPPFVARGQRRKCEQHDTSSLTRSKRAG